VQHSLNAEFLPTGSSTRTRLRTVSVCLEEDCVGNCISKVCSEFDQMLPPAVAAILTSVAAIQFSVAILAFISAKNGLHRRNKSKNVV
jgi:hypothetical protein